MDSNFVLLIWGVINCFFKERVCWFDVGVKPVYPLITIVITVIMPVSIEIVNEAITLLNIRAIRLYPKVEKYW